MGKYPLESEKKEDLVTKRENRFWQWTGFSNKTLWNFLELLIVPAFLAGGAFYLEYQANERQREIADARYKQEQQIANDRYQQEQKLASDRYQQETLKVYFDQITQLLIEKNLRNSKPASEVGSMARARTVTALRELDGQRKGILLKFLTEANLISREQAVVELSTADLSNANLEYSYLYNVDLHGINLIGAKLSDGQKGAVINKSDLSGASLDHANLSHTNLKDTNLSGADLKDANLTEAKNLKSSQVKSAKHWELAKYSPGFRKQLGLPPETVKGTESSKSTP